MSRSSYYSDATNVARDFAFVFVFVLVIVWVSGAATSCRRARHKIQPVTLTALDVSL